MPRYGYTLKMMQNSAKTLKNVKRSVLILSQDEHLFENNSDAVTRQKSYAKGLKNVSILVYTKQAYSEFQKGNLRVIPTNSRCILSGFFQLLVKAGKLVREHHFDVITTQDPFFFGLVGYFVSKRSKALFRPQLHMAAFEQNYWRRESVFNYMQYLLGRILIKKADCVRVVNTRAQDYFKGRIPVCFIPVPTSPKAFTVLKSKKDIDVLCVARLTPQKNLFFLIEVIAELKKEQPHIKAVILGGGPLKKKLEKRIQEKNLKTAISILGPVPHDELNKWYARSKVFVLPSLSEGWGLVSIEASLAGVPVVMSNTGCAGSVIVEGVSGKVCAQNDLTGFVRSIQYYLQHPEQGKRHSNQAQKIYHAQFNEKLLVSKVIKFLNGEKMN